LLFPRPENKAGLFRAGKFRLATFSFTVLETQIKKQIQKELVESFLGGFKIRTQQQEAEEPRSCGVGAQGLDSSPSRQAEIAVSLMSPTVYGKPVLPSGSTSPSPLPFLHGSLGTSQPQPSSECAEKEPEQEGPTATGEGSAVESLPRPLSPTKLTPIVHSPLRYQSDADLEALRRKLANAPRPLKKRSSITEPEGPGGPNIQKLLYQRFNTLAGGMEGTPFYQPSPSQDFVGTLADVDNGNTNANGNLDESIPAQPTAPLPDEPAPSSDANDNELPSPEPEELICPPTTHQTAEPAEDNNNNVATVPSTEQIPSPVAEALSPGEEQIPPSPLSLVVHPPAASVVGILARSKPGLPQHLRG
jgi:apoptosis-stimulating of p53 protein 1